MNFQDFVGNEPTITNLREMLARDRFPHAVILAGSEGAGKYTLAQMLAKTMNCLSPPPAGLPDFCGVCANCMRIGEADHLDARFAEAVEARESLRETDKKETRILVQTHPDVLVIPPDPPQGMIKVDQVRRVPQTIYRNPAQGGRRVYIFTESCFMREAANALLKVLEEPPAFATIFLLTCNPGELLPTIRSRAVTFTLAPLAPAELESLLAKRRSDWPAKQRALIARLSHGALGKALAFDLAAYIAVRSDALALLNAANNAADHSPLFHVTEGFRSGAEGKAKLIQLLQAIYSLLQDLTYLKSNTPELVRNIDIQSELERMASSVDFAWIQSATRALAEVETGMRRNLLRSLSLDALAVSLEP